MLAAFHGLSERPAAATASGWVNANGGWLVATSAADTEYVPREVDHIDQFVTHDIADLGVTAVETVLIGHAVKRPGK